MNSQSEYWIIDTDYSNDDQLALLYLIPRINIIAITVNSINTNASSLQIKKKIEEDLENIYFKKINVYAGSDNPFINYQVELKDDPILNPYKHKDFSKYIEDEENDISVKLSNLASMKIAESVRLYEKNLNILTLGPLTNISIAFLIDSTIRDKFNKLYIAGGSYNNMGNSGNCAEYNFRCDPVASKNVINNFKNIILITIEIEHALDSGDYSNFGLLASIIVLNPWLIKISEVRPCDVDIMGRLSRGGLIIEKYETLKSGKLNNITIIEDVETDELEKIMNEYK